MPEREKLRRQMIENAAEIDRLYRNFKDGLETRVEGADKHAEWIESGRRFSERYQQLCIPDGWDATYSARLKAGDVHAVEVALCFLEVRPYFFRSGYMWNDLLRKCKRAPMTDDQALRFRELLERYQEWKNNRTIKAARGAKLRDELAPLLQKCERFFPVSFPDTELDGISTVGEFYIKLCRAIELVPAGLPNKLSGTARKPFSPGRKVRNLWFELLRSQSHNPSTWNAADVWETLVAAIRDAYRLQNDLEIKPNTVIRTLGE